MKYCILVILIVLYFFMPVRLQGQTSVGTPFLYLVTVDPETGFTVISWYPSSSISIIEYYRILESQASVMGQPDVYVEISDKIPITDTTYIIKNGDAQNKSVGYTVVAYDDNGLGPLYIDRSKYSPPDSTMFLQAAFDSCLATITLTWNDYNTWKGHASEYNIYRRTGAGVYNLLGSVAEGTENYILTLVQPNETYDLFVEAVHEDGRRSTSNRVAAFTKMTVFPSYINADYATINAENKIDLSFTVDVVAGITKYNLLRSTDLNGPYTQINSFDTPATKILYTDNSPFTSNVFFYRLEVLNDCGLPAALSNRSNNIILNGALVNNIATLNWNAYEDWHGGVQRYRVIRARGIRNPIMDTVDVATTGFTEDINVLANYENPEEGLFCYTIIAEENPNIYGIKGKSKSNQVCFSVNPDIRIPNAFIPNDAEIVNQIFEPVFSFLPEHYEMMIFNRLGTRIWQGNEGWDGRVNGKYVPEGTYLYYIRIYNYARKMREFNGKVVVLYR
jgi:gliding motility-associated-like protein